MMETDQQTWESRERESLAEHNTLPETNRGGPPKPDHSHIQGWGIDLDPKNRPAVPMERTPPRLEGIHWRIPVQQPVNVKVFHSIERPDITPVFGTSVPPSGLSGGIRSVAFRFSENDLRHWLLLLMADRVNVVEGVVEDLGKGHIPNIFSEMGIKAEWKYNRAGLARKAAVASAVIGLGYFLLRRKRSSRFDFDLD